MPRLTQSYFTVFKFFLLIGLVFMCSLFEVRAQMLIHKINPEARYNIDAKRAISDPESRDGLLRSIEFKKIDSTYYVGYMFEGIYREQHAADYPGYKQAIPSLLKAVELLEKDFNKELNVKTTDYYTLFPAYGIQMDYQQLVDKLWTCYMNTEQYQQAYDVTRRVQQYYMQLEYYFNTYTSLAWLIHKIRMYTTKEFSFLKNSVAENEALAQLMLDSALISANVKDEYNMYIMPDLTSVNQDNVVHYRAMLYSYNLQIDSADKYYDLLKEQAFYSHNNRGNYLSIKGAFSAAAVEYELEAAMGRKNKELREYAYFTSILDIYKARPDQGLKYLQSVVKANGSTPGYGWYNIGLARAAIYDGDLSQAEQYIQKASRFKELHIGTSFGQGHYDFSLNVVKLTFLKSKLAWLQKRHKSILLSPRLWGTYIKLIWEIYITKHLVITQLADNPERDAVLYKIFATESTTSWDEVFMLIESLNPTYFIEYYEELLISDTQRPKVHPYYKLLLAKLYLKEGNDEKAKKHLLDILSMRTNVDDYHALLMARTYELLSQIFDDENEPVSIEYALHALRYFPQVVGYSNINIPVKIEWIGQPNDALLESLQATKINFIDQASDTFVILRIEAATSKNSQWVVNVELMDPEGQSLQTKEQYTSEDLAPMTNSICKYIYGMMLTNTQ